MTIGPVDRRLHLPSFALLRSFVCAARHESFTLAAGELHLSQSAISRQIRDLEALTGVGLFRRVGRRVRLTEAGRTFAQDVTVDLERIHQSIFRAVAAGDTGAALRIATLPTFASRWLIPRLADFEKRYPGIEIALVSRLEPFDITGERCDLAIHFGRSDWPETSMTRLCEERMIPVASPDFAAKYDLRTAEALLTVPIIHLETRPGVWNDWFALMGLVESRVLPGKWFDQFSMIIEGAKSSLGAALLPRYLIEEELRDGVLVPLSDRHLATKRSYYAVRPLDVVNVQAVCFIDWMVALMRGSGRDQGR